MTRRASEPRSPWTGERAGATPDRHVAGRRGTARRLDAGPGVLGRDRTPQGADCGVDVVATGAIAQVEPKIPRSGAGPASTGRRPSEPRRRTVYLHRQQWLR